MDQKIERVDNLPLILYWLEQMRIAALIDAVWQPHGHWEGLSYGQLAVVLLAFIIYTRTHRLSYVETWGVEHHHTLTLSTGWQIGPKDLTDDRLGRLVEVLGADEERSAEYQKQQSQQVIRAYTLPTEVVRYDTTTFNVHHTPTATTEAAGVLAFGYSKDHRPDLLQFKQGLGTLDPAGVPLLTQTVGGQCADDGLYLPAWRRARAIIGQPHFLYVGDCKGSAEETRATIAAEEGYYLFPQALTGDVPELLQAWVCPPPESLQSIVVERDEETHTLGRGFAVEREMTALTATGNPHTWTERWVVTQSTAHAQRQQQALRARLVKTQTQLTRMRAKATETAAQFVARAEHVLTRQRVTGLLHITVTETVTTKKHYLKRGRPGPNTPYELQEHRRLHLQVQPDPDAIAQQWHLAGWRIYVTNVPAARLSVTQATIYYRDQWLNERGYHRFKHGSLPALPLFLRIPARIKGLMLLLMVALQALTLLEFVAHRELAQHHTTLAGLVPGNPQMATSRPSAERLLAAFDHFHLLITISPSHIQGHLLEPLSPLQELVLTVLNIPLTIYQLDFSNVCIT